MQTLKTTLFLGLLTGLVLVAGRYLGGQQGLFVALIISICMNVGSYWFSDKIVLSLYRAKEMTPEEFPTVHKLVQELSLSAGIPKPKICLVDMAIPNAFATGRNQTHAVVAVTRGILNLLDERELRGVLAHELAHIKNRDILISSIAATCAGVISYIAQFAYWGGSFVSGGQDEEGRGNALGTIVLLIMTPIVATLLHLAISRSREFIADETAAYMSKDPESLASALKKLHGYSTSHPLSDQPKYEATAHLFIVNPLKPGFLMSLFSTHPAVDERIQKLHSLTKHIAQ